MQWVPAEVSEKGISVRRVPAAMAGRGISNASRPGHGIQPQNRNAFTSR